MYFTKEQIEQAKSANLLKIIENNGYKIKKEKNAYRILGIDGGLYVFEKNQDNTQGFYWHKHNIKGNAIDFCKIVFQDDYISAINRLLNNTVHSVDNYDNQNETVHSVDTCKEFTLPERDNNIKKAYSYLVNTRGINKEIVSMCIKNGIIRQFNIKGHTYVGFIGKDTDNNSKYLMLRLTNSESKFKQEYINSDKRYGFKIFNKEAVHSVDKKNIYVFESPIDLLSYITLFPKKNTNNNIFISMGGVSSLALEQFIDDYKPKIGTINICFDSDKVGQENANKIKERLTVHQVDKITVNILKPMYKDYNEDLMQIRQKSINISQNIEKNKKQVPY